ncbi:Uncharacterized protein Rs2_16154 [Raphanus sativus]|nr:Uncharacterized protein Rs2_16154 [Raphanus sativus]
MPQYITDDTEVGAFIELRRSIAPVDLLVSVISPTALDDVIGDREDAVIEDDDWHEFAMADTPLTTPATKCNAGPKELNFLDAMTDDLCGIANTGRSSIPYRTGGVEIREPDLNTRQRIQPQSDLAMQKGKKKMRIEATSDTDSDSDDDMVVPVFRTTDNLSGKGNRPIWDSLIFGIAGIPNTSDLQHDSRGTTLGGQSNQAPESSEKVNNTPMADLGVESETADVHIGGGTIFGVGGLNSNTDVNTFAATMVVLETNFIGLQTCRTRKQTQQSHGAYDVACTGTPWHFVGSECNNYGTNRHWHQKEG